MPSVKPIFAAVPFFLSMGCSGASQTPAMPPTPDPDTRGTLAGPLCDGSRCRCKTNADEPGLPDEGFKRFEVILGPSQSELWATIDNNVFYKGTERASECYYVDLPEGEHHVGVRAKGAQGFGARLKISEQGAEGPWWFDSFEFSCGAPGLCDHESLRSWKRSIAHVDAGKHAPCGSVRIMGIDWTTGRMPDSIHPEDFLLEATMKIYKFTPDTPPGDPSCVKQK